MVESIGFGIQPGYPPSTDPIIGPFSETPIWVVLYIRVPFRVVFVLFWALKKGPSFGELPL